MGIMAPIIRNLPQFPQFRVLEITQDLYHQQYQKAPFKHSVRIPWRVSFCGFLGSIPFRVRARVL